VYGADEQPFDGKNENILFENIKNEKIKFDVKGVFVSEEL
jgi:hypothetical protein